MKKRLLTIVLLVAYGLLPAQYLPLLKPVPEYSFANFDRNRIVYPGDSLALELFFRKMDSVVLLGKGNVSIMHIGGSHVQAGVFTQQFRDDLLSISPDLIGGQYFVFPFSAGGTNNPSHFIVKSAGAWNYCRNAVSRETDKRMGLAGAAITTSDSSARLSIMTREKHPSDLTPDFDFNKVTVLGFSETGNVTPVVSYDSTVIRGEYDEWKSTYTFTLPAFTDSICIWFDSVPGEFTLTGVLLESDMPGISVHGVGVNGASVPSYLRCDDFERDLELIRPDLIMFSIGINDAVGSSFRKEVFQNNYDELIQVIKRVNPDCALLFITNNDSFKCIKTKKKKRYEVNTNGKIVEEAFMEMGEEYNAAVWNQFEIMGGLKSMLDWEKEGLAKKDKVHFTGDGYRLLGDLLYNALITRYIEHVQSTARHPYYE